MRDSSTYRASRRNACHAAHADWRRLNDPYRLRGNRRRQPMTGWPVWPVAYEAEGVTDPATGLEIIAPRVVHPPMELRA